MVNLNREEFYLAHGSEVWVVQTHESASDEIFLADSSFLQRPRTAEKSQDKSD